VIGEVKARLNAIDLDLQGGNRTFLRSASLCIVTS
jgi:hypothetical protein